MMGGGAEIEPNIAASNNERKDVSVRCVHAYEYTHVTMSYEAPGGGERPRADGTGKRVVLVRMWEGGLVEDWVGALSGGVGVETGCLGHLLMGMPRE